MIAEQIDQDLKSALKEKNEIASSALRNLKAGIKNSEIESRQSLSDEEILKVISKQVKRHKDSIESFKLGNRTDLVKHEQAQMAVLEKYLPVAMSEQELSGIVSAVIKDLKATPADFGKVMKEVMGRTKGQADGNMISRLVKEQLSGEAGSASGGK